MSSTNQEVIATLILEVLGRPPEHLIETLEDLIRKIRQEKGVRVEDQKIHTPKELKDQKDLYSTYAEVEVKLENPFILAALMFKYMPANIEIVSPEKLTITNNDFTEMFNELTGRLHNYEKLIRVMQIKLTNAEAELKQAKEVKKEKTSKKK